MIPVIIVAGFLGAGKTTLLRSMLQHTSFRRSAIIVNEVGDIGLDREALRTGGTPEPMLLSGGCVCCAMRQDLVYTLRDLMLRRRRGLVPEIDQIVVETTGIADPSNMLAQIGSDPWARSMFGPLRVLTVVDALNDEVTWPRHSEARNQLAFADAVYVSKTDLVGVEVRDALLDAIQARAPWAFHVSGGDWAGLKSELLCQVSRNEPRRTSGASCHDHEHSHAISTAKMKIDVDLTWAHLSRAVDFAAARHKDDLLRCKGVVRVSDIATPLLIQSVRDRFAQPVPFRGGGEVGYLSFIARHRQADAIVASLGKHLQVSAPPGRGAVAV